MVKKITAPKSYDPGKGRPREHLAYLNEREMAYLRQINGNNMERGPRGLPSFPPDDAIGSSSRSSSSGNKTGVGGGGGGGGGSTGSRGSSTGSVGSRSGSNAPGNVGGSGGANSRGPGGPSGPNSSPSGTRGIGGGGQGGQRGAGSNYGAGSGRPGTTSTGGSKGPSSPMGGQGSSFSAPSKASSYNRDQAVQQRASVRDTAGVVRSNSALKGDLQVGGIKTINVGPMGTPVSVGKPISPSVSSYQGVLNKGSIAASIQKASVPQGMYGPRAGIGVGSYMMAASQPGFITSGMPSAPSGMPPAKTRGLPSPDVPLALREYSPYDIRGAEQPYGTERVMAVENVPEQNVTQVAKSIPTRSAFSVAGTNPYESMIREAKAASISAPSGYSGYSFDAANDIQKAAIDRGVSESVIAAAMSPSVPQSTVQTASTAPFRNGASEGLPSGYADRYGLNGDNVASADELSVESWGETPYGEPGDIQRKKDVIDKYGRYVPNAAINVASRIKSKIHDAIWGGMTTEERIDRINRNNRMDQDRIRGLNGNENDRGPNSRNTEVRVADTTVGRGYGETAKSGGRPQAYFDWDAGVNIPSPGDSDYTLYLKYLEEKAAAQAAVS